MAYDERTADRVRNIFSGRQDVVEKKMMGGLSFMVKGAMVCRLSATGLLIRLGPEARGAAPGSAHARPTEFARRLSGFVCVDPEGYQTDAGLSEWLQRGVDFASRLPEKRASPKAGKKAQRR
jgi:TfoX/Sxy family transcriptional regulator of competence genes